MKNTRIKISRSERGQAIIIIVFAIIGLIGMTALVVDGSLAFSNRRHAQNAADTASLAAARAKVRDEDWKPAALAIAGENDFVDDFADQQFSDPMVNVEVYGCDEPRPIPRPDYAHCGDYEGNSEYLVVTIISTIDTTFARVIGIQQMTNRVKAIAQAKPSYVSPTEFGQAMISLMCGCKGDVGWPHDPFTVAGNSLSVVGGSGVFVNSDCSTAFDQSGAAEMEAADGICVVGGIDPTSNLGKLDPDPDPYCGSAYSCPPPLIFPNPSCDTNDNGVIDPDEEGVITGGPAEYTASPGYYSGDFPSTSPSGTLKMLPGVYCIEDDFSLTSSWIITSDLDGDGHDPETEGVLITTINGGVSFNGSSHLELHAINDPDAPEDLQNILLFIPPGNTSTLSINGNNGSSFTGSIWAPSSHCTLEGSGSSLGLNSQIMCFTMATAGSAQLDINYDQSENHVIQIPPSIEQTK